MPGHHIAWKTTQNAAFLALLRSWYSDGNAIARDKVEAIRLQRFAPLFTSIIRQGVQEGTFSTAYPERLGQVVLCLYQSLGDAFARLLLTDHSEESTSGGLETFRLTEQTVAVYTEALERVLGAPPGSLQLIDSDTLREWFGSPEDTQPDDASGQATRQSLSQGDKDRDRPRHHQLLIASSSGSTDGHDRFRFDAVRRRPPLPLPECTSTRGGRHHVSCRRGRDIRLPRTIRRWQEHDAKSPDQAAERLRRPNRLPWKGPQNIRQEFYEEIGVGFELPVSFSKLTAMENVTFFQHLYGHTVDIEPLMQRLGLWPDRDKKVAEYSKGMKMRLNFVRAILNEPKMLFLDEPTDGLDPVNARILKDMVLELKAGGGTVFLTSHIMSDVDELCDRVAFIAGGKLVEMDSPRNLKLRYGQRTIKVEYAEDGEARSATLPMDAIKTSKFHRMLETKNIETIHSGETTLEEIFVKIVGVELHD